jgi:toxin CcdB
VVLQSDVASRGPDRIVAPLSPRAKVGEIPGRLTPRVTIGGSEHVVIIWSLTVVHAADLRTVRGNLLERRDDLIAALDYLFLGV